MLSDLVVYFMFICIRAYKYMDVSKNSGTPKWMVYNGGGTIIFGNTHICICIIYFLWGSIRSFSFTHLLDMSLVEPTRQIKAEFERRGCQKISWRGHPCNIGATLSVYSELLRNFYLNLESNQVIKGSNRWESCCCCLLFFLLYRKLNAWHIVKWMGLCVSFWWFEGARKQRKWSTGCDWPLHSLSIWLFPRRPQIFAQDSPAAKPSASELFVENSSQTAGCRMKRDISGAFELCVGSQV